MSAQASSINNDVDARADMPAPALDSTVDGDKPDGETSGDLKITVKEAADLMRAQAPATLLALLKKPEFSDAVGRVFAGYRVNVDNLKTPLTRGRLTSELVTNSKLLDALLALPHPAPVAHSS